MSNAEQILGHLQAVDAERARRDATPGLQDRVLALKTYQQRRFARTYDDLMGTVRYGPAARFFLEELYGPRDYSRRDAQFARVVPALVRLFPRDTVDTVRTLAELHALSEQLDTATAERLPALPITAAGYAAAWQAAGRAADREKQVALTLAVGQSLDRLTRNPLLRQTLRMMRGPARTGGLGELQQFLETGFDTFKAMRGAQDFLSTVGTRERQLAKALFEAPLHEPGHLGDTALGQLP